MIVATHGIIPREFAEGEGEEEHADHDHGSTDPHTWQSVPNAKIYVANIAKALSEADPAGAETYTANAAAYAAKLMRSTPRSAPPSRLTEVEHGRQERRDTWRDGGFGPADARPTSWRRRGRGRSGDPRRSGRS